MGSGRKGIMRVALFGVAVVAAILIFGTLWMGQSARRDTVDAVHSVSLLYLDELAGRREQVVEDNLNDNISVINMAIGQMTADDLSDLPHLQAYQARMRKLFQLEKFAFVDGDGLIYTATGVQTDIDQYPFDYRTLSGPEIYVKDPERPEKKVIIAVPADIAFDGKTLGVCFMEIDMQVMLQGVSMQSQNTGATFCNIYTRDGIALSNTVLGGLAVEDNLLKAMEQAKFADGYSLEGFVADFREGRRGVASFTYNGIQETLSYVPVAGTDWLLTYLIRESVISEQIGAVSDNIIRRSLAQSMLTVAALVMLFGVIIAQTRRAARATLEKETAEAENRVKRQALEQRLALQEQLLEQRAQGAQQARLIAALSSDYWSVYYLDLDEDRGVCYQAHGDLDRGFKPGDEFPYLASVKAYADAYVTDAYRADFMAFVQPDAIREGLAGERVISFRYVVRRHGKESYEMVRFAGVRRPEDRDDHTVHGVSACFANVDAETRKTIEQSRALSEALAAAEEANKAKTVFLSNMSHEIRTPMNAIIGLNNIALNDPETPERTRGYLEKMGVSANHLLSIINDILDMSRIESGRMAIKSEEFSFPKLLEQINTMISGQCREKGLRYECRIVGRVDDYYIGDDVKLKQVMINILGNAVKFTPEGGSVTFTVEEIARYSGNTTLRFTIRDTGIGMSPEYLPKLFETFSQEGASSTSRYGSTGLGMPITKSLVELMNGTIEVRSEKGVGTTFTVTLPFAEAPRRALPDGARPVSPGELTVLVIDDDPIACEHAKIVLGQVGASCETAASGAEAVEMVKLRHARMEPYDLILVDWKMPEMDGVETTRAIRRVVGHDTAIIILTSYNWDDIVEEARSAGVDSFVAKPLFANSVMDEFRAAFKNRAAAGAPRAELKGRRALMAEDVAVNAEIMKMVLGMREMAVEHAENGHVAVEMFAGHPEGYYDAILMDMRMPEMDGLEATRLIRAMGRRDSASIPIVALTANAFDEDVQRSMQAGLNAHLSKPVQPEDLFQTLERLIYAAEQGR